MVLDNFDGILTEDFLELQKIRWKLLAVTRADMGRFGYACQRIGELREKGELEALFENSLGRKLRAEEHRKFDRIVELAAGHTLVLMLTARQIARSCLGLDEALELAGAHGFAGMAAEKVDYVRDGRVIQGKVSAILRALYDVSALSEERRKCLKLLSLFDGAELEGRDVKALLKLESLDDINALGDLGWLETAGSKMGIHPLIRETLRQTPWTKGYREAAIEVMGALCREIEESRGRKPSKALSMARSVLSGCGKEECLRTEDSWRELMLVTLLYLPRDEEAYIIENAGKLFGESGCGNPCSLMELYDYVVYLLCQRESYEEAGAYLGRARSFARRQKDHYVWGLYYAMLNDYQDALLDGPEDGEQRFVCHMMWAWYYTLCEPDQGEVLRRLGAARDANEGRAVSGLDTVDYFYIPAANMMCELGEGGKALDWLEEALALCGGHGEEIPYVRRKQDLLAYELEVRRGCDLL